MPSLEQLKSRLARAKRPAIRLQILASISEQLIYRNTVIAEQYTKQLASEASASGDTTGLALADLRWGLIHLLRGHLELAASHYLSAIQFFSHNLDPLNHSKALRGLATARQQQGHYQDAFVFAYEAERIQNAENLHAERSRSLYTLAGTSLLLSDFKSAARYANESVSAARQVNDSELELLPQCILAEIQYQTGSQEQALRMYHDALSLAEQYENNSAIVTTLGNIADICVELDRIEEAYAYAIRALRLAIDVGAENSEAFEYLALAKIESKKDNFETALNYIEQSRGMAESQGNTYLLSRVYQCCGYIRERQQSTEEAKSFYFKALEGTDDRRDFDATIKACISLIAIFEKEANFENALRMQKRLANAQLSLKEEQTDQELMTLHIQQKITQLELERESYLAQVKSSMETIEYQSRDIAKRVTEVSERREFLQSLRKDLLDLFDRRIDRSKEVQTVFKKIDRQLDSEHYFAAFNDLVLKVNATFFSELRKRSPELTEAEMKVCVFLKLRLRSIDIANALHVSERTVQNHCAHIRKKMRLRHGESLKTFVATLP